MEKYLDTCLTSLIIEDKNLLQQVEVLVVIDGATDRSSEIAHSYQNKFPNTFIVIDKENGNYGSCINRGLKEATGKYVKVLDADDSFNTANFQCYLQKLLELDVDMLLTDFVLINEHNQVDKISTRALPSKTCLSFVEVVDELSDHFLAMHSITYKRSILCSIDYSQTEGISYTDFEWCFLPMTKVVTIYYLNLVVYRYLIGREGQTVSDAVSSKSMHHRITIARRMVSQLKGMDELKEPYRKYLFKRFYWFVDYIYRYYLIGSIKDEISLVEFDLFVRKEYPFVYEKIAGRGMHKIVNFKFIKSWRANGYKRSLLYKANMFIVLVCNKLASYF